MFSCAVDSENDTGIVFLRTGADYPRCDPAARAETQVGQSAAKTRSTMAHLSELALRVVERKPDLCTFNGIAKPRQVDKVRKDTLSCHLQDRRRKIQTIDQRVFPKFMPPGAK